jgi:hypothetical protein
MSLEQRYLVVEFRSSNNKRAILLLIWNYMQASMRLVWIILVILTELLRYRDYL